ncbi:transcriptional regulator PpsR [Roseovarius azorensis]|uniref:Transcriptional regulator PpsR n=1 Tax=Roseovarius azorensis TaxID=1287727 RepID=A0A1H7TA81_9RHOB|nr:transcriptional regulator PpsR [Roseovarius azorensis]SEL81419.1 transcriptional regulator PpsR [Roseovarius azorensis]
MPEPSSVDRLIEQAFDIAVFIDNSLVVTAISVSPDSPSLGRLDHWIGREFESFLNVESREKFAQRIALMRADPDSVPGPIELNHSDNANWEFPVRYTLHREAGSDGLLLLGRDMQPLAEIQQRLVREQVAREREVEKYRGIETCYRVVLEASETPLVLVEPEAGRIRDINSAAALLLGSKRDVLTGSSFAQVFEGQRRGNFIEQLKAAASSDDVTGFEAVARRNGRVVSLSPNFFRASGEVLMLCRLALIEDEDAARPESAQSLSALFEASSDAIVLTDGNGVIRDANEGFLILSDAAQLRDVQGRSMADFLSRGSVDLKLILDNTRKKGRMRSYSAQFQSVVGTRASVDISATSLRGRNADLGVGLIIRDVTPRDAPLVQDSGAAVSDEAMRNVMDLVGTASLKELVSATSDVVEKMCIETAVRLTNNNRVAAAEMLGLSRQSLYVKLRKYGLLNAQDED